MLVEIVAALGAVETEVEAVLAVARVEVILINAEKGNSLRGGSF